MSVAQNENVGWSGSANFTQTGGTNGANYLNLGNNAGSSGAYSLSGSSYVAVAENMSVGYSGTGSFVQSGGTNNIGYWLNLGDQPGGFGAYSLSGSGVLLANSVLGCQENVGLSGTGSFMQTGGANTCSYLAIGEYAGSSGTYSLGGGYLSVGFSSRPTQENVGDSGMGVFAQTSGTNSCSYFNLGNGTGSRGTYSLSGGGLLSVAQNENVGYFGTGIFTQSGGTNSSGNLTLGNGTGSSGTYSLSGSGLLSEAQNENVGYYGTGIFTQSGGTNSSGNLTLGNGTGSRGCTTLKAVCSPLRRWPRGPDRRPSTSAAGRSTPRPDFPPAFP